LGQLQGQGNIQGSKLMLADHRTGIHLGDGVLQAHLNGRSLVLDKLRFASGQGDVVASGSLDLRDAGPDAVVGWCSTSSACSTNPAANWWCPATPN
jgi:translocation and assembly module TamB